jgi:hypothetical protein
MYKDNDLQEFFLLCREWRLISVILVTQQAKIVRFTVWGQSREKVHETPSEPVAGHGGGFLSSKLQQEVYIGE